MMTEERRRRISEGMKGKNTAPRTTRHKRSIALAQTARLAAMSSTERSKRCSICHELGHNAATCTKRFRVTQLWVGLVDGEDLETEWGGAGKEAKQPKIKRAPTRCSICGQPGHRRTTCPQATAGRRVSRSLAQPPELPISSIADSAQEPDGSRSQNLSAAARTTTSELADVASSSDKVRRLNSPW